MDTIKELREQFPALGQMAYGKPLVYLDNAATAQKPMSVIELCNRMNSGLNANVHRGMYMLSEEVTALYEQARENVREFINAPERENIIFTSGTTASINLVASSWCGKFLKEGDIILISEDSHHSNIVPWQLAAERAGASIRVLPVDDNGQWEFDKFESLLDERVKFVALTHIANVLGLVNPVKEAIRIAHLHSIPVLVDGAQGCVHENVDVQELDCDFYAFSGHKIYAATGTGILYGKAEILNEMPPYMGGGDMVGTVTFAKTTHAQLPLKFEAGTPNFIGAATYTPAIEMIKQMRNGELAKAVKNEETAIKGYLEREFASIEGLEVYGKGENKIPLYSFSIEGVHPLDMVQILDKMGMAFRTGMLCAEPTMARFGVTSMMRISFAPYNTLEEAEAFVAALRKGLAMLR